MLVSSWSGVDFFFLMPRRPPRSTRTYTLLPYTTLFRSSGAGNWEFSSASLSIGFHVDVSETLRRQLPVASAIVKAKCHERLDKAIAVIRDAKLSDQDLLRYKVDPVEWFGSIEAALMAFSGGRWEERRAGKECVSTCRSRWSTVQ